MKKTLFSLLTPILFFVSYQTNAQGHILGFGSMDGGVENQTVGAAPNVSGSTLAMALSKLLILLHKPQVR